MGDNMECEKCDRNPFCDYRIDATTVIEQSKGEYRFVPGRDCPKDWQDKKVEDMTEEQCREAVKELRGKLLTENKSAEEIMARTGLWENPSEAYKEAMDRLTAYEPMYKKPPLGCKPSWISSCERIKELSEAITRNINGVHKDVKNVRKWATEILYHCEIMEKC
jgi:hypothetical protein